MTGKPWPENLTMVERRIAAAKRTSKLVDHLFSLSEMHEANAIVIYTPVLAEQFRGRSRAAYAFNQFRHSMQMFELVRLAAIWDPSSRDKVSIPTVISFVSKPKFRKHAAKYAAANLPAWPRPTVEELRKDPDFGAWVDAKEEESRTEREAEVHRLLKEACALYEQWASSPELAGLRRARNDHLAHNIDVADPSVDDTTEVEKLYHGDEGRLMEAACQIVEKLHRALNQGSVNWNNVTEVSRARADDLWSNCRFNAPGEVA